MKTYKYKGISENDAVVNGIIEAFDEIDAVLRIKPNCKIVTEIREVKESSSSSKVLFQKRIPSKVLAVICSQFAIILASGIPIVRCTQLIAEQCEEETMRGLLRHAAGDIDAGMTLAHSFEHRGEKILPPTFIETIRAGEDSGTLEASFSKLNVYFEKDSKTKNRVKSAMSYPIFLLALAAAVVMVCMVTLVPTMVSTFASLNLTLPLPTRIIMAMSDFFSAYWWLVLAIIFGSIIFVKYYKTTDNGRLAIANLMLKIPVINNLVQVKNSAQFASTVSTMLSTGITAVNALSYAGRVLDNSAMGEAVSKSVSDVIAGKTIAVSIAKCKMFPPMLIEMISVGEESGKLEETLDTIADYYDYETEIKTKKLLGVLEPTILLLLAGIVAFILISVYYPMFSMYGSM